MDKEKQIREHLLDITARELLFWFGTTDINFLVDPVNLGYVENMLNIIDKLKYKVKIKPDYIMVENRKYYSKWAANEAIKKLID